MKFVARIREALQAGQRRIARTPFAIAMKDGAMSAEEYAIALVQLRAIHGALELAFDRAGDSFGLFDDSMRRAAALDHDLERWKAARDATLSPATREIMRNIDHWSRQAPWRLLGSLYVLEDLRMGSRSLIGTLAAGLCVAPEIGGGLDYHIENSEIQPLHWRVFKAKLEAAPLSIQARDEVCAAARETMEQIVLLYKSLPLAEAGRSVGAEPLLA